MYFGYVDWFIAIGSLLALIIFYGWRQNQFFRKLEINHLKPTLFFGSMLQIMLSKIHIIEITAKAYRSYPNDKYVGIYNFMEPSFLIKDVDLVKQITVKDFDHFVDHIKFTDEVVDPLLGKSLFALEGDKWKEMRNTLSPAFTSAKMRGMFPFVIECAENLVDYLKSETEKPASKEIGYAELDTKDITGRYANDVIASCAFGYKVDSLNDKMNKFFMMTKNFTEFFFFDNLVLYLYSFSPFLTKIFRLSSYQKESAGFFRKLVTSAISNRETQNIVRHDMIHLLMLAKQGSLNMDAATVDDSGIAAIENDNNYEKNKSKKTKWTEDEITAQAMIFLFAGFDTTSQAISFMLHELAINNDVQKKLQEEIDNFMADNNGKVELADLNKLKYLDMVVTETLRLWPSAPVLDRVCVKPYTLPPQNDRSDYRHQLKKGDSIWISAYDIHRDPKYYKDPNKFIPERFSDENGVITNTGKYLPFGMGPRACIGSRFALMGLKIIALYTLTNFDIVATPKTNNPVQIKPHMFNISPETGFWIGIKKRDAS